MSYQCIKPFPPLGLLLPIPPTPHPPTHTYHEDSNERPLKEAHQHIAPVVFVVRHSGVAHEDGKGEEEKLDCWAHQSGPSTHHACLDVELK